MKRFYCLLVSCLVLVACGTQSASPSSASKTGESAVYDQLVKDYQTALESSIDKVDNPLVNPNSVEVLQRTTEGAKVISKRIDLDKNGQEELLIGVQANDGQKDFALYMAAYGLVDGKVVDLLADIFPADVDIFLTFYESNYLLMNFINEDFDNITAAYTLTDKGFEEKLYLASILDEEGNFQTTDREGKSYDMLQLEEKIAEVLGHALEEKIIK